MSQTVEIPRLMSIRQVAKTGLISEYALRKMEKEGKLPCVYSGVKCLVNFDKLVEQLERMSERAPLNTNDTKE